MTHINISPYRLYLSFYITSCFRLLWQMANSKTRLSPFITYLLLIWYHFLLESIRPSLDSLIFRIYFARDRTIMTDTSIFNLSSIFHQFINLLYTWVYSVWCPCAVIPCPGCQENPRDPIRCPRARRAVPGQLKDGKRQFYECLNL